jgi:hypothetical protein
MPYLSRKVGSMPTPSYFSTSASVASFEESTSIDRIVARSPALSVIDPARLRSSSSVAMASLIVDAVQVAKPTLPACHVAPGDAVAHLDAQRARLLATKSTSSGRNDGPPAAGSRGGVRSARRAAAPTGWRGCGADSLDAGDAASDRGAATPSLRQPASAISASTVTSIATRR